MKERDVKGRELSLVSEQKNNTLLSYQNKNTFSIGFPISCISSPWRGNSYQIIVKFKRKSIKTTATS